MNTIVAMTRQSIAWALVIAPVGACAQPVDQQASAMAASKTGSAGLTRQVFLERHSARLLARDTDGDGRIGQAEFVAAGGKGVSTKRFAKMDRNADGLLDKAEIDAMLTHRFSRMDANADGVLSAEERATARAKKGKAADDGSNS